MEGDLIYSNVQYEISQHSGFSCLLHSSVLLPEKATLTGTLLFGTPEWHLACGCAWQQIVKSQ